MSAENRAAQFAEQRKRSDESSARIYREKANRHRTWARQAMQTGQAAAWWWNDKEAKRYERLAETYEERIKC